MALQMVCPFCKKEFPYNNGELDAEISRSGQRINTINRRLSEIKYLDWTNDIYKEKRALELERAKLIERLGELKAIRKACDQQIKLMELILWKKKVREEFGEDVFKKMIDEVEEDLQAYSVSSMMKHGYTRSNSKSNVTSINKI